MAVMPNFEDEIRRDFERGVAAFATHFTRHHGAPQAPAAQPVTVDTAHQEDHMQIAADMHAAAARLEKIGEDGLVMAEKALSDPSTAKLCMLAASLAGQAVDPAIYDAVHTILAAYTPAPVPAPAVAGQ